ncbi:sulfate ABC transporter permease subunit CysT [Acetobacter syzygii]|uniref:Sulfate transport system permease protein CysT n=1 Tax=Acetobacter syzygii TaxID=146476 RepID=A0A270BTT8_9PROT|nr:sulfate ABC transporter permease subunit CysT [Acetobacter syzygii]NSL91861.1 sulfate ABC transporter permease subunit CysT [Acetobacter syzygii]PAL28383.1 sulfate ABC transporter permease subunit CysT [Acetobacter syzygii]PAL28811.1 sulfate ABC transporter permease subunit CysT [Acetobacter syzygii]GAN71180.1 ABC transporter sulfate permease CysW/CysT [Acetobacter syzygii]GBR63616.1 sulfate transporter permease CysT [Acetobacter syzygii NRIC 0483]
MRLSPFAFFKAGGSALPGYRLSLTLTLAWTGFFIILPLSTLLVYPWQSGPAAMLGALHDTRMLAALWTSFSCAGIAAACNIPCGFLLAWALARGNLPGHRLADALIDLPLALPTAVSGITLATLYGPHGWLGALLSLLGISVSYNKAGIVLALMFVGLPFVVRAVEPVLRNLPHELEEAAHLLGARPWQIFVRIIAAPLLPALVTGFGLAFARGIGEYGSVIFIAGNQPFKSEIAPLLIVVRLQEFDYPGATAIALVLLCISLLSLALIGGMRRRFAVWSEPA